MREVRSFVALWVVAILGFTACDNSGNKGSGSSENNNPESNLTKVEIGYSQLRISLPVFVAKEEGIFERNGIDAELSMYPTAQPLMQALVAGKIDIAGYTALPITYIGVLKSRKQLLFISTMVEDDSHRISYLLRKKMADGSNNPIQSIADLKGKKIGILPTIAYKGWIEAILRENNLEPRKDVYIQQIPPSQQPLFLKSGQVDALFTNDPAATSAIASGVAELFTDSVECPNLIADPFPFGSFNISKEWADANPATFKKIVKSINEAIDFISASQKKAKLNMKKYLPKNFKPHVELYPNARYLKTTESSVETFNNIAALYLKQGIIQQELKLDGLVITE